jgi:hypothetical protein
MQTEVNSLLDIQQTIVESQGYAPSTSDNRYQLVGATGSFKTFPRNHLECKIFLTVYSSKTLLFTVQRKKRSITMTVKALRSLNSSYPKHAFGLVLLLSLKADKNIISVHLNTWRNLLTLVVYFMPPSQ